VTVTVPAAAANTTLILALPVAALLPRRVRIGAVVDRLARRVVNRQRPRVVRVLGRDVLELRQPELDILALRVVILGLLDRVKVARLARVGSDAGNVLTEGGGEGQGLIQRRRL
jgi:tetrahydromethanopterin S-methyltransferase subunit C